MSSFTSENFAEGFNGQIVMKQVESKILYSMDSLNVFNPV